MTQQLSSAVVSQTTQSDLEVLLAQLQKEPNAEFLPLANNPHRFIEFLYFLRRQTGNLAHKEKISNHFKITERQVRFYAKAGEELFGLFHSPEPGYVALTALGKQLSFSRKEEVEQFLFAEMKKLPIVKAFLNKDVSIVKPQIIEEIQKNEKWVKEYSLVSIERRADTIRSWVDHIQRNGKPVSEREILKFVKENSAMLSNLFAKKQQISA